MIFLCRFQRQRLLCLFRFVKICRIHFLSAAFYRHNSIRKKTADRFYKTSRRFIACFIYFYSIPSSRFTSAISSGVAMLNCTASSSLICGAAPRIFFCALPNDLLFVLLLFLRPFSFQASYLLMPPQYLSNLYQSVTLPYEITILFDSIKYDK